MTDKEKKEIEERKAFHKKYLKSKKFKEVCDIVDERDGCKCCVCGRTGKLIHHHTSYRNLGKGGIKEANDVVLLCQNDHLKLHSAPHNLSWFSPLHPRNIAENRYIEYDGYLLMVSRDGSSFFDVKDNYKKLKVYNNKKRGNRTSVQIKDKRIYTNRIVAKAFPEICGEWFDDCEVHHINRDKTDNRPENLKIMTIGEHKQEHAKENGDTNKG